MMWYRSDAGVVLSSGKVSQWQDQSGNGLHMTPVTATGPDYYAATADAMSSATSPAALLPGQPSFIRFPNVATIGLRNTATAGTVNVPFTLFIVSRYSPGLTPTGTLLHSQDRVR